MDDPEISPEAQQVIDRLRALLSQLEKDLEEIRFKASYLNCFAFTVTNTSVVTNCVY